VSRRILISNLLAALLVFGWFAGMAGAADKPAQDQARRLQQQLRAAERDKSQVTAKNAELETQLKDAQSVLAEAKRKGAAAGKHSSDLERSVDALKSESDMLRTKLSEAQQALADEQRKLAQTERRLADAVLQGEAQNRAFAAQRQRLETALTASRERNERMYKLGFELIDRYERSAVSRTEPFTGLKRAQIEKLAEEEREKFDKDRLPSLPEVRAPIHALPEAPSPDSGAALFQAKPPN
jgi:chromosome segregation ATPase